MHLLGGRPDVQASLRRSLTVFSADVNRFTFDAKFGDYFNGKAFVEHPEGAMVLVSKIQCGILPSFGRHWNEREASTVS